MDHTPCLAGILGTALTLSACGEMPSKETIGTGVGAVAGGVIGSEVGDGSTAATIAGTILGAVLGRELGKRLEASDQQRIYHALENNEPATWRNPQTDTTYQFEPTYTFTGKDDRLCREYTSSVLTEGRREIVTGTACRHPDGSWEVAED